MTTSTGPIGECTGRSLLHSIFGFVLAVILAGASAAPAGGQQVDRERQLPIAPESGVIELSPELRLRLQLFPEVSGFRVARLWLRDGGETILEVESFVNGELRRERRLLSEADLRALRDDLVVALASSGGTGVLNREGRGGFVFSQTLLGLGFYGWAVPYVFDIDSAQAAVAAYLLTAGATFYLPYRLSRDRNVSEVHRDLAMYGGTRGILAGVLLGDALIDEDREDAGRVRIGAGLLASVTGSVLGFTAAGRSRPTDAQAALWRAMGDFGFALGAGTAYVAGPYAPHEVVIVDGDLVMIETRIRNRSAGHFVTVAGGVGGVLAGKWLAARRSYTEGNVHALRSAGILGAQLGATLGESLRQEEPRVVVGGALAGGIAGIVFGDRLLDDRRFSAGEGLLVNAGHLAGAATALGITYLVTEEMADHALLYLGTSTLGSFLGAGLVYRALGGGSGSSGGTNEFSRFPRINFGLMIDR